MQLQFTQFAVQRQVTVSSILVLLILVLSSSPAQSGDRWGILSPARANTLPNCLFYNAGAPPCCQDHAPGSTAVTPRVSHHVGDAIDVVNGNKYQYELDFKSFASGLTLARHYNSLLEQCDFGLGAGWRHTYQVSLQKVNQSRMDIVQSDGRQIRFVSSKAEDGTETYLPSSPSDGYLETGEQNIWHLVDGRRMFFQGASLYQIDFGDFRGTLTLEYSNGMLDSVTGSRGDVLSFNYRSSEVSHSSGVETETEFQSADDALHDEFLPGRVVLDSVTLPSGDQIKYVQDAWKNLVQVEYPEGESLSYGYQDERWPGKLTERRNSAEKRINEWVYDHTGKAIAWIEDGKSRLQISRNSASTALRGPHSDAVKIGFSANAIVNYGPGRDSRYSWIQRAVRVSDEDDIQDFDCESCAPAAYRSFWTGEPGRYDGSQNGSHRGNNTTPVGPEGKPVSGHAGRAEAAGTVETNDPMNEAVVSLWNSLSRADSSVAYTGSYPHAQGDIPFSIASDRNGQINRMVIGSLSASDIAMRSMMEPMPACFTGNFPPNRDSFAHDRIFALGTGEDQCQLDAMILVLLKQKLDSYSSTGNIGY